jgi:hypothetical protein
VSDDPGKLIYPESDPKLQALLGLPTRTLGPHPSEEHVYRTVFVIARAGQDVPDWTEVAQALEFVLAADAHIPADSVTYWGEVEVPAALRQHQVEEWLRRHPECWSREAYIGYAAGQRAAAGTWQHRSDRLRQELSDKLYELANAVYPTAPTVPDLPEEPYDPLAFRADRPDLDDIPF